MTKTTCRTYRAMRHLASLRGTNRSTGEKSKAARPSVQAAQVPGGLDTPYPRPPAGGLIRFEPAGDFEEPLDEVLAVARRVDMGHLVGHDPLVRRTSDEDLVLRG